MDPDVFLEEARRELNKLLSPARIVSIEYRDALKTIIVVIVREKRRWPNIIPPSPVWDKSPEAPIPTDELLVYREAEFYEKFECNVRYNSIEYFARFIQERKEAAFEYMRTK